MKSKMILGLLALVMALSFNSCAYEIDAGYEGIKVNLYGSEKGVDDVSRTGIMDNLGHVYEYPTFTDSRLCPFEIL